MDNCLIHVIFIFLDLVFNGRKPGFWNSVAAGLSSAWVDVAYFKGGGGGAGRRETDSYLSLIHI